MNDGSGERLGLGMDIGGTGMKAAVVDLATGALVSDRTRLAGVVLMVTFGTGSGSVLVVDGVLVPNSELGLLDLDGYYAETRAAASARDRDDLSWGQWAKRVQRYLRHVEMLFSPDLFVVGGGVSKVSDKWLPRISIDTPIVPAAMRNNAGVVGAALSGSTH